MINLYLVKHEGSERLFLFQGENGYKTGDAVICSTGKGEAKGIITNDLYCREEDAKNMAIACHAYWPLAKIIKKYEMPIITSVDDVPAEIVEAICKKERGRIIKLIKNNRNPDLPFDM